MCLKAIKSPPGALRRFFKLLALVGAIFFAAVAGAGTKLTKAPETSQWTHLSSKTGIIPPSGPSRSQTASLILDIDKNGLNDFVIAAGEVGPSVVWYRRETLGWTKYVIDSSALPIEAGGTWLDIDGDGDLDIVFGADGGDNKVWWWENPYPYYAPHQPWTRREIKNSGHANHHDQITGDFDGDGKPELVFWNQQARKLFLAEIPDDPRTTQPWQYTEIFSWPSGNYEGLVSFDLDQDGIVDIVGGGLWLKHLGGTQFATQMIDATQTFSRTAVGQVKEGGWPEVVFVTGDGIGRLKWYEWTDGQWVGHDLLGEDVIHGHSLQVADFNGDGHLDVFCAEMRQWSEADDHPSARMWIFFGDGAGHFTKSVMASGMDNHETKVADLDGDGDIDILSKPFRWDSPRIDVWLNKSVQAPSAKPTLDKWRRHVIDADRPWRAVFVDSADVDGDGKRDLITGGWWYRNPGKPAGVWSRQLIGWPLNNMAAVYDFDRDGDIDVLGTKGKGSEANSKFVWARNDGRGTFTVLENIDAGQGDFLQGTAVATYSNQAMLEVAVSWHEAGRGIQMLTVPSDPGKMPWRWRTLSRTSQDEQITAADIDRDGTIDLLLGTNWLCNECPQYRKRFRMIDQFLGTNWFRWQPQRVAEQEGNPDRNRLVDMNGDGRLDAVVGFEAISVPGKLAWYEQPPNATDVWKEHHIAEVIGPMSLDVIDMDGDGDFDVIVGEHNLKASETARLLVFENLDGKGHSWTPHLVHTGDEHHDGALSTDIDGDGDLDIISIGWGHSQVVVYENLAIQVP